MDFPVVMSVDEIMGVLEPHLPSQMRKIHFEKLSSGIHMGYLMISF